jgi:hypothetical protein
VLARGDPSNATFLPSFSSSATFLLFPVAAAGPLRRRLKKIQCCLHFPCAGSDGGEVRGKQPNLKTEGEGGAVREHTARQNRVARTTTLIEHWKDLEGKRNEVNAKWLWVCLMLLDIWGRHILGTHANGPNASSIWVGLLEIVLGWPQ